MHSRTISKIRQTAASWSGTMKMPAETWFMWKEMRWVTPLSSTVSGFFLAQTNGGCKQTTHLHYYLRCFSLPMACLRCGFTNKVNPLLFWTDYSIGVGGWGIKGRNHCALFSLMWNDGWCFSHIVSFLTVYLINEMRGLLISLPFYYLFHREGSLPTAFHCFSLATILHDLSDNILSFKEEASFGF